MSNHLPSHIEKKISFYSRIFGAIIRAQNINFWVLVGFLPTFVSARLVVYFFPNFFLEVRGVHIHHLTYGIIILSFFGILALNLKRKIARAPLAMMYGIGLALAFDEFGMWIHLEDDYWIRYSYDAVIAISSILILSIYLPPFVKSIRGIIRKHRQHDNKN